jgi:hypothetical protein
MRFLTLSVGQAATIVLLTAAAIVALYFLKLRHRRVMIASSLLWQRVLDEQQAHSLWEKLRKILSIVLAVTIGLLIAFGLARPEIERLTGKTGRVVIVLDASPTMLAHANDGQTRWQHAQEAAISMLQAGSEFRLADTAGRFDSAYTTDRSEIRRVIQRMQPIVSSTRFPAVNDADARVVFITDGVAAPPAPKGVTRQSVFEPAANVGIVAFEIRALPSTPLGYEAFFEAHNYGREARETSVTIAGAGRQHIVKTIQLQAGQSFSETFDLSQFEGGPIRATVRSDDDAFSLDDVAFAYLPIQRKTRTLLVTTGNPYLETVLKLNSLVALSITTPADFRESSNFDAYIFDRFAPSAAPSKPSLVLGAPNASWLRPQHGEAPKPSFTTWMEDHPLMQHVSLHDVSVQKAAQIDASGLTVIAGGSVPLIVSSDRPKWVWLTFDLQSSDFPFHAGFPVFMENSLAWLSRERPALYRSSGIVEIPVAGADIQNIDGRAVNSRQYLGRTVFETSEPGLYVATRGDVRQYVAVNLTSRQYSDINHSSLRSAGSVFSRTGRLSHELWFYLIIAALVLVAAEWFTYHRRITL